MQAATWRFLQDLVVEIDGSFVFLFSEHQVSHHLSENTQCSRIPDSSLRGHGGRLRGRGQGEKVTDRGLWG